MSSPKISAVIIARNEAHNIEDAIASLNFASQIVVADSGSRDNTVELARRAGAEVHGIEFDGFGPSKNRALQFCRNEWIFSLDADERVSPELAANILKAVGKDSGPDGYLVSRLTYFLGKPIRHSGWYPEHILRLFRRGKGQFTERLVHENITLDGTLGQLEGPLYHYSYRDLGSYLDKLQEYSTLSARELYGGGRRFRLTDILLYPPAIFCKMYLLKAGFLDGYHGLLLALLSSFHVLIKYAKLRELSRQPTAK
jgi:glycosyltransferase involved in cell wall biosynthesis